MKKGVVMKLYETYAIVMSDNQYIRIKLKSGLQQGQKILFTSDDVYHEQYQRRNTMAKGKFLVAISACLALLLFAGVLGVIIGDDYNTSLVVVDINPSVQIELDKDELVIGYEELNEDAMALDLSPIIGMTVEDAVEYVVSQAEEKGFIDVDDLVDDYVLITTVSMFNADDIEERLTDAKNNSEALKGINLALTKATAQDIDKAEEKGVPLGLLAVSEYMNTDGAGTVKEFFANKNFAEAFKNEGVIIHEAFEHKINRIIGHLDTLDLTDEQKENILSGLNQARNNYVAAMGLYADAKNQYQFALQVGDRNGAEDAENAMENANALANSFANNAQVEQLKDFLLANAGGEPAVDELLDIVNMLVEQNRITAQEMHQEHNYPEDKPEPEKSANPEHTSGPKASEGYEGSANPNETPTPEKTGGQNGNQSPTDTGRP